MKSKPVPQKPSGPDEDNRLTKELKKQFQEDLKKHKPSPHLTKTDIDRMSGPIGSRLGPKEQK